MSSHSFVLSSSSGSPGIVGMSQLVSTMLETVHAMWSCGLAEKQCLSFIESKLREFYLQSETLATFLLATEFCSLNTLTSSLNLTDNDIPLLMSIASYHSPGVTRKYGVSFR
jgi:folliculin-interacting protein 2